VDEEYWAAVRTIRLRIADFLADLTPGEWDAASLCDGWRIRDVAGHLALVPTITTWELLAAAPRGRFNMHRMNTVLAVRHGSVEPARIVAKLRANAGTRATARVLDTRDSLFDAIVHSQDMAVPLGREFPVPAEHSRAGLERVWSMGWPFRAQRRFAGLTLRATDADWTVGTGPDVSGPSLALLLLLTGRTAVAARALRGPGVAALRA
jgi:uncharacterized protein (TIGR03083 family)